MSRKTSKKPIVARESVVCRTISLSPELLQQAQQKISTDPESDFSKYVRGLIRADLAKEKVAA